jgi:NADPH:quinone reductase-like Zn-dependent oxidoreductase
MRDKADAAGVRGVKVAVAANGAQLSEIAALIDAGAVRITLARCLPLARIAQAYALSRDGHVRGKIVLTVDAEPPAP